ncbi:MAG: hypothetical protein ACRC2A_09775 [Enterobacterales bacterium]|uniref:hypothetical protein n=1 Tax=Serratia sp. (in: enterobacteria) TaxID=616 RepID=UPI003F308D3C
MTSTIVPAGSHRATGLPPGLDRNSLPNDEAIRQLHTGLKQGIQGGGYGPLRTVVTQFRDVFPKLSLWERFKDFFGLSETADNRRDAAALCVIGTFYDRGERRRGMEPVAYNQTAMTLAQILRETGLAPERGHTELEGLTADITARLLAKTRGPEGVIILTGNKMTTTRGTGDVFLTGQVSFGNAANTPELLRNLSLPFVATVDSPLNMAAELIGGEEDATTLRTLFGALAPENRAALQRRYEQNEGSRQVLFSRDGVLGELSQPEVPKTASSLGQPSVPAEWTEHNGGPVGFACEYGAEFVRSGLQAVAQFPPQKVANVKDLIGLLGAFNRSRMPPGYNAPGFNITTGIQHFNTATGVRMNEYVCHHQLFSRTPEECLLTDFHRGGVAKATVVVDGHTLLPLTTQLMQAAADDVALIELGEKAPTTEDLVKVGEAWASLIQEGTELDARAARAAAASIMYAVCQQGAGRGCLGLLTVGPGYDTNPQTPPNSQDVMHIDTQREGGGTQVTLATFSSGCRQVGVFGRETPGPAPMPDFRAYGVSYPHPASTALTVAGMAAGFLQNDIRVEGFGVRYPKTTSLEALKPLPSPEGWSGPWVLTRGQQATLDAERSQRGADEE